jgi:hypothetical protein
MPRMTPRLEMERTMINVVNKWPDCDCYLDVMANTIQELTEWLRDNKKIEWISIIDSDEKKGQYAVLIIHLTSINLFLLNRDKKEEKAFGIIMNSAICFAERIPSVEEAEKIIKNFLGEIEYKKVNATKIYKDGRKAVSIQFFPLWRKR